VKEPRAYVGGSLTWGTVQSAWQDNAWLGTNQTVASSYTLNWSLFTAAWRVYGLPPAPAALPSDFSNESSVRYPIKTPVLCDGGIPHVSPGPSDNPANDIFTVKPNYSNMATLALPRHGKRGNAPPTIWPQAQPYPGAVNVAFFDGHGEAIKLDDLWKLYWHATYQPPLNRPGL
jgi:prepilin-type processing-associated H-X9-DG protein